MTAVLDIGAGASRGGSSFPPWLVLVVIVIIVLVTVWQLRSRRGPAVRWFPRSMRGSVNREFEKTGWDKPYDENGEKIPRRDRG